MDYNLVEVCKENLFKSQKRISSYESEVLKLVKKGLDPRLARDLVACTLLSFYTLDKVEEVLSSFLKK